MSNDGFLFVRGGAEDSRRDSGVRGSTTSGAMREERTADFPVCFCALFFFTGVECLFAFFDGDTLDLHRGSIAVVRVTRRTGHENIQPFNNLAKDRVFVIEVWRGEVRDEKL